MSVDEGREAAIRGLHSYKEELLAQIEIMRENLHHVERSIELLSGNGKVVPPVMSADSSSSASSTSRYAHLKGQAAVELFLQENPNVWFKASVVAKELLRRGMPKTSKAFGSAIAGALNRTVEKGLAVREKRDGILKYHWKNPDEPI